MFFQLEKRELIDREVGRVMATGTDHINISIRELGTCNLSIGRAIEPKKGMAIVNAGIRKERSMEQRRTPALGFIELLYKYLGIPREHVYVTLTEHKGEDFHLAETCTNVHGFRTHRLSIRKPSGREGIDKKITCSGKVILGVVTALTLFAAPIHGAPNILIDEQFASLEQWEPFSFPKIDNHSSYKVTTEDGIPCLVAKTSNSASAILYKEPFNVYDYPEIAWRWKVTNVYRKGDSSRKDGDDYPVRLYILFQYDPGTASFGKKIQYEIAKLFYGSYPPDSSLNYIWANKEQKSLFLPNPFTGSAMMFPVDQGSDGVGRWSEHQRNIVRDYQAAFGEDPPPLATLAVMSDSDNTGESATAYIEYIRVFRQP